jgi:hypothetical protein
MVDGPSQEDSSATTQGPVCCRQRSGALLRSAYFSRHALVASYYSAGRDVPANLISEPSRGTNLDIAATDQIRPIATTMAIAMDMLRMCIPLACVQLGEIGARMFFVVPM